MCHLQIRHCWSSTMRWWPSTTQLWSWFVANLTALQCRCLAGKAWAVLPLATLRRPFFAPATTVRTVTTLTTRLKEIQGTKGAKRGEGACHGRLHFLAQCRTARGEDVKSEVALNTVAFILSAELDERGNVPGFSTFRVSWVWEFHPKIAGLSCPRPGRIVHGEWTCEKQQIPIPETPDLNGNLETYPGNKHFSTSTKERKYKITSETQIISARSLPVYDFW